MRNDHAAGSKEVPAVIERILKIGNATIHSIAARFEALDVLSLSDLSPNSTDKSLVNVLTTTCTPPVFRFFSCHASNQPFCSFVEKTSKRVEIQIREDNSKKNLTISGGSSCELRGFSHVL